MSYLLTEIALEMLGYKFYDTNGVFHLTNFQQPTAATQTDVHPDEPLLTEFIDQPTIINLADDPDDEPVHIATTILPSRPILSTTGLLRSSLATRSLMPTTGPSRSSLPTTGPSRSSLATTGPSRSSLVTTGPSRSSLATTGPSRSSLATTGPSRSSLATTGPSRSSLTTTGPSRSSLPTTGPSRSSLPTTGPSRSSLPTTGPSRSSLPTTSASSSSIGVNYRRIPARSLMKMMEKEGANMHNAKQPTKRLRTTAPLALPRLNSTTPRRTPTKALAKIMEYESFNIRNQISVRMGRTLKREHATLTKDHVADCIFTEKIKLLEDANDMQRFRLFLEERLRRIDPRPYETYARTFHE